MRLMSLCLAFTLCLAGSLTAQDGEKVSLEWKFKKGETFRYEMSMSIAMDLGGMEIDQEMIMGQAFEVTDLTEDGTGTLKVTYDRIKFKMDGPMSADFDSDKDKKGEDMFGAIFGAMVGKSMTLQLNRRGEVLKVEGMAKMMEDIIKDLPEEHQAMAGMMKGQMNDDYAKSMSQMSFGFLPKGAIAKGDSWDAESKTTFAGLGKADLKGKSTLKEIRDGKEAVVSQEFKLEFKGEGGDGPLGATEVSPTKTKGEMVWLLDQGRMKSSKSTSTMEFSAGGQDASMTMKIEMKLAPREKPVATPGGGAKEPAKEPAKDPPKEAPPKDK